MTNHTPITRQPPPRYRLEDTRFSINHKFTILQPQPEPDCEGYLLIGLFEDGQPGELFIHIQKCDGPLAGFADQFAIALSMLLQSGWTVEMLARKFKYQKFEPRGLTKNKSIPMTDSIVDYIMKFMEQTFVLPKQAVEVDSSHTSSLVATAGLTDGSAPDQQGGG